MIASAVCTWWGKWKASCGSAPTIRKNNRWFSYSDSHEAVLLYWQLFLFFLFLYVLELFIRVMNSKVAVYKLFSKAVICRCCCPESYLFRCRQYKPPQGYSKAPCTCTGFCEKWANMIGSRLDLILQVFLTLGTCLFELRPWALEMLVEVCRSSSREKEDIPNWYFLFSIFLFFCQVTPEGEICVE